MAEQKVTQTKGRLDQTRNRLQHLSNDINDKETKYNKFNEHYTELAQNIEQQKRKQEDLQSKSQDLHNQWVSKEMWISNLNKTVHELQSEVLNIKLKRREDNKLMKENLRRQKEQENQQTRTNYQKNLNRN